MPTARELLEQADALMRSNRERAIHAERAGRAAESSEEAAEGPAEVPEHATGVSEPAMGVSGRATGVPEGEAEFPGPAMEIPELSEVVTIGAPPTRPHALDDVPELVDAVEKIGIDAIKAVEIDLAPIADLPDIANELSEAPAPDRGDSGGHAPAVETATSSPPEASAPVAVPEPEVEPEPLSKLELEPEAKLEPEATLEPEPRSLWSLFSFGRKSAETVSTDPVVEAVATSEVRTETVVPTAVTIATAPAIDTTELAVTDTDVASTMSMPPIDTDASAPALPLEDAVAPFASDKPVPADDWARWEALAEEIRMQVLQRIDIFTDTRLREQLSVQLQPIVDRASAELVATINEEVGKLIRTYIAEAIEREIETWRKGNT